MGLIRSIPFKNATINDGQPEGKPYTFLKEVDFEALRMRLAASDVTSNVAADSDVSKPMRMANLMGMQANRDQLQYILNSYRKGNAWLFGPKGVGKTAVVEDYLRRVSRGKVDAKLSSKPTFVFDVNDFFALPREQWVDAFETSLKKVAEERGMIIIDHMDDFVATADNEAARLVSTLIKHLERDEKVQAIIISEQASEKKIEDLSSGIPLRFQKMNLRKEPSDEVLKQILISHFRVLEQEHNVDFSEDTADEMIRLMRRYPGRAFKGKQPASALEFADSVAAYVRCNQYAPPVETIELEEKINVLEDRFAILAIEGDKAKDQRDKLAVQIQDLKQQRETALAVWNEKIAPLTKARTLLEKTNHQIDVLRQKKTRSRSEEASFSSLTSTLELAREAVEKAETDLNATAPKVEVKHVQAAFGLAADLPMSKLREDKRARLAKLDSYLDSVIFKQDDAKKMAARIYRQRERGTNDPSRPAGVIIFVGGTGLGKTALVRALTIFDLGLEDRPDLTDQINPVTVELSQFGSAANVSSIQGAAPGLIGFGETPKLLSEVQDNPRANVLWDEADKAHPTMFDVGMQILENGSFTDARGEETNFKDTIIFICLNGLTEEDFKKAGKDIHNEKDVREMVSDIRSQSPDPGANGKNLFRPEFVNRVDAIVVFQDLGSEELQKIFNQEIRRTNSAYRDAGISIEADEKTRLDIIEKWPIPTSGGRAPRQIVKSHIRPVLDAKQDERDASVHGDEVPPSQHFKLTLEGDKVGLQELSPIPAPVPPGAPTSKDVPPNTLKAA